MPATESRTVAVLTDFAVSPAAPNTMLRWVSATSFEVGRGSVGVFAFPRPGVPARCIASARLQAFVQDSSGSVADGLAVYPSHVFDALEKRDGTRFGYSGALLDSRPRGDLVDGGTGWTEWNVTRIVRTWVGRRAFPSRRVYAPDRGPIVLALRDLDLAPPFATATITSAERKRHPRLVVEEEAGCG